MSDSQVALATALAALNRIIQVCRADSGALRLRRAIEELAVAGVSQEPTPPPPDLTREMAEALELLLSSSKPDEDLVDADWWNDILWTKTRVLLTRYKESI